MNPKIIKEYEAKHNDGVQSEIRDLRLKLASADNQLLRESINRRLLELDGGKAYNDQLLVE